MNGGQAGVVAASFLASGVELVEALTIVLAVGAARSWRSSLWGTVVALATLAAAVAALGPAITHVASRQALQLVVGALLLVFGLQWLRKAILRSAGLKDLHDEEAAFATETARARTAGEERRLGLDWYAFTVAYKGVLLEGLEVVFIVISFGATSGRLPLAIAGAAAAALLVLILGVAVHRPLAQVPENTVKHVVGLLLCTFGLFWMTEGLGSFAPRGHAVHWPGGEAALPVVLAGWFVVNRLAVHVLRTRPQEAT